MLDRTRLGRVLLAYEAFYQLPLYLSRSVMVRGTEQFFLLKDEETGVINQNIIEMFEIILEMNMLKKIDTIETYVPEFESGGLIITSQLSNWIKEVTKNQMKVKNKKKNNNTDDIDELELETEKQNSIIRVTKIIDYLFRNFKIFLVNIREGINKIDKPNSHQRMTYTYKFPRNIDILFLFMVIIPDIHKGMIDDNTIDKFIQILKLDEYGYVNVKGQCKRGVIFIKSSIYYVCLYRGSVSIDEISNKEIILQNTKGLKTITSLRYNALELSSVFGLLILVGIISALRPMQTSSSLPRSSVLARRPVLLSSSSLTSLLP